MVHIEQPFLGEVAVLHLRRRFRRGGTTRVSCRKAFDQVSRWRSFWKWHASIAEVRCDPAVPGRLRRDDPPPSHGPLPRYALELTGMATIQDVAGDHLHVGWDLIKELKKSDLARRYGSRSAWPETPASTKSTLAAGGDSRRWCSISTRVRSLRGAGKGADA